MKPLFAAAICAALLGLVGSFFIGPGAFPLAAIAVICLVGGLRLVLPIVLVGLLPTLAFADGTTIAINAIWQALAGYLVPIIGAVLTWLVGMLLALARKKLGISIDDSMRNSLQTALTNGAGLVLSKIENSLAGKSIDVKNALVAEAVNYVVKAAPDAIKHFGLTPEQLAEKIVAKLPVVANTSAPAA